MLPYILAAGLLLTASIAAGDQRVAEKALHDAFPAAKYQSFTPAAIPGYFEVVVDQNNIVYVSETGRHMFIGDLVRLSDRKNFTQSLRTSLQRIDVTALSPDLAVVRKQGSGQNKLHVFSDPDCTYCKQLEFELMKLRNVTIYTYLFPIEEIHPGASAKARKVWCDKNPGQALSKLMLSGAVPNNKGTCLNPIGEILVLGAKLGIDGTPTMFDEFGRKLEDGLTADAIQTQLQRPAPRK